MEMKGRNELAIYSEDEEVRKAPRKVQWGGASIRIFLRLGKKVSTHGLILSDQGLSQANKACDLG